MDRIAKNFLAVSAFTLAMSVLAGVSAQAQPNDPKACANGLGNSDNQSLSDKLNKSGGVICPPNNVDPNMKAPTPQGGGKMPVIPPPGSPGGDPHVQPK
jgi:hypothetical protein